MIEFEQFVLENGLKVIVHRDETTPMVAMNILYNVGSRDEDPDQTGFAHLFEHLMFGGSINIPKFDEPLERCGGENNAFTSSDITSYYLTLPAGNIETAFWLESDRMLMLAFSEQSLEVQRNVVIEEFKQRFLNYPYGDVWLLLRALAYKKHPYRWATIGLDISHIANAGMDDVKAFFAKFYHPANAILSVTGNIEPETVKQLATKWFGPIESKPILSRNLLQEPVQPAKRTLTVERDVPYDAIYFAWHMCNRLHPDYHVFDLLTDYLSGGNSSRFYRKLVQERQMFSEINAYITGESDAGLLIVSGKLAKGISMDDAENAILEEIALLKQIVIGPDELQKLKNKAESTFLFAELNLINKAMVLAQMELLGDAGLINGELMKYQSVTAEDMLRVAQYTFLDSNSSILYYFAKGNILPVLQPSDRTSCHT